LLLPTVSVPVLFLALVLASMVEPSVGRERCAWKHHGRAGVTPSLALEFRPLCAYLIQVCAAR
jgi:hypothetical protein